MLCLTASSRAGWAALLVLALGLFQPAAAAGTTDTSPTTTTTTAPAAPPAAPIEPIDGFRSAKFGMNEVQVLAAIEKDFGVKAGEVSREDNPLEKTVALVAKVSDLIPDSGPARAVYILGYKSKALIQVNVVWGKPVSDKPDLKQLATTANILQRYFADRSYVPSSVFTNRVLQDKTVLIFTGADTAGHQVTLTLGGVPTAAADATQGQTGTDQGAAGGSENAFLRLSYVASPGNPDVFKVAPGAF
jgi:hypothetical protein